jgi:enediyne biosynthesis protein E4
LLHFFAALNRSGARPVLSTAAALAGIVLAVAALRGEAGAVDFEDATDKAGISFVHDNGARGDKYVIETVGAGSAFFDYDNDGDLDIYLVNGAEVPDSSGDSMLAVSPAGEEPRNALYRNEGDGTFADVTVQSGSGDGGYGMGCAAGDIDNDGDLDLYLANFGPNVLYRNEGKGIFADVTAAAGVGDDLWGSSCAFADVDLDGYADLYVANYHDFSYSNHKLCAEGGSGLQLYCGPEAFNGVVDVLYRNQGDGTFRDITAAAGLESDQGKELGVIFGDVDWDGDPDLYLANDKTLNFLFLNDGDGHFTETGLLAGTAYNEDGDVEAGMGVDMADVDNDGWPDLFVTNFQWETNTFYRNMGDATFLDDTFSSGLGKGSIPYLSWGTRLIDLDNDGDRDVFIANGHLESDVEQYENTTFAQRNQVFLNNGGGFFTEFEPEAGSPLALRRVSRGAAFGDYDGDGAVDILVNNIGTTPTLMRNRGAAGNWLQLHLVGTKSNAAALGARVELVSGDLKLIGEVRGGGSYLSHSDLRLHFGLGGHDQVERLVVRWPSGAVDQLEDLSVNRVLTVKEGGS